MSFISSIRTRYLSWSQSMPLPILEDAPLVFQAWHRFDQSAGSWIRMLQAINRQANVTSARTPTSPQPTLSLITWNVDAFGKHPEARMEGIISRLRAIEPVPDVVFFQEVSRKGLIVLLDNEWIRDRWISSEADEANWAGVQFSTLTLISKERFNSLGDNDASSDLKAFSAGPVWRIKYPSRFQRDALCSDIFYYNTRIRLINVHLDSLPINPNQRPRQVEIAVSFIRQVDLGRGLIAGDFNPVSDEDATLVADNGLCDAWEMLQPEEDGFTWGLGGSGAPFPPGRLDKVAMLGLKPERIEIIHPGTLLHRSKGFRVSIPQDNDHMGTDIEDGLILWSDHSGIFSSFRLVDA